MDINYLFLRQQIERSRAEAATSSAARTIHEQLAKEYERRIEDATEGRITFIRPDGSNAAAFYPSCAVGMPSQEKVLTLSRPPENG